MVFLLFLVPVKAQRVFGPRQGERRSLGTECGGNDRQNMAVHRGAGGKIQRSDEVVVHFLGQSEGAVGREENLEGGVLLQAEFLHGGVAGDDKAAAGIRGGGANDAQGSHVAGSGQPGVVQVNGRQVFHLSAQVQRGFLAAPAGEEEVGQASVQGAGGAGDLLEGKVRILQLDVQPAGLGIVQNFANRAGGTGREQQGSLPVGLRGIADGGPLQVQNNVLEGGAVGEGDGLHRFFGGEAVARAVDGQRSVGQSGILRKGYIRVQGDGVAGGGQLLIRRDGFKSLLKAGKAGLCGHGAAEHGGHSRGGRL